ncbi:DNA-binding death effector domain-containing protein 2-like isoform X1 [Larus michahellis]|uniref:DNA-binding death effector domain-containing protein 2-like isoform X1 n=1 Tax=Larus michahellis TaxID=119627 RepID=UPI003D9B1E1A
MLPLHRLFEVVGAQLTPREVARLAGLLEEAHPHPPHPLDPSLWGGGGDDEEEEEGQGQGGVPSPRLREFWRRRRRRRGGGAEAAAAAAGGGRWRPRDGRELLLELERRGLCDEGNFGHLLRLLRAVARHDLLRCVSLKRPRPVSPERGSCGAPQPPRERWETGSSPGKRKRSSRSRTRPPLPHSAPPPADPPADPPAKVTCDIRLRVRAELCEHDAVLRRSVASSRPRGPWRQLDVFGQASGVLKSRDLGSILCDIKFSELSYLEAFWGDYLSGALLRALEGVFLTEGLRRAVGRQEVRLLVSVDQDDYEEGRRRLLGAAGGRGGED